jgi:progesterone-induced-blocking factor 1
LVKQKELEENNKKFMKNEEEIKKDLRNLDISETEYQILSKRDEDILTIKEFVQIKFYEAQRGLKIKFDELLKQNKYLDEAYTTKRNEYEQLIKNYEEDKRKLHQTTIDYQKMYFELADTKSLLQQANFKRDNYDKTKL